MIASPNTPPGNRSPQRTTGKRRMQPYARVVHTPDRHVIPVRATDRNHRRFLLLFYMTAVFLYDDRLRGMDRRHRDLLQERAHLLRHSARDEALVRLVFQERGGRRKNANHLASRMHKNGWNYDCEVRIASCISLLNTASVISSPIKMDPFILWII